MKQELWGWIHSKTCEEVMVQFRAKPNTWPRSELSFALYPSMRLLTVLPIIFRDEAQLLVRAEEEKK